MYWRTYLLFVYLFEYFIFYANFNLGIWWIHICHVAVYDAHLILGTLPDPRIHTT